MASYLSNSDVLYWVVEISTKMSVVDEKCRSNFPNISMIFTYLASIFIAEHSILNYSVSMSFFSADVLKRISINYVVILNPGLLQKY